jgi:hypothetical protein
METTFHNETPAAVRRELERARVLGYRVRLHYGSQATGRDWLEGYGTEGYIGRSTGRVRVPLIVHNARSTGGPAILDHWIVRIVTAAGGRELYRHPNWHTPALEPVKSNGRTFDVTADGEFYATFSSERARARFLSRFAA